MGNIESSNGVGIYYRTLPDGDEEPCGKRLDLDLAPSQVVHEIIQTSKEISLTLLFDGKTPFSYDPEDLGISPRREEVLKEIAETARGWCNTIIIMESGSKSTSSHQK